MNDLWLKTVVSGIFFGTWPLVMNKSKLPGNVSSIVFCGIALLVAVPFAIKQFNGLASANWIAACVAGVIAGMGLLAFNGMLAKATPENVSSFFLVNLLIQVSVPAIYQIVVTKNLSTSRGVGFIAAAIAAIFLTR